MSDGELSLLIEAYDAFVDFMEDYHDDPFEEYDSGNG